MNSERETISITIRSKRVPVGTQLLGMPYSTPIGPRIATRRVVFYEYILDGKDEEVVREARGLAKRTGARLVVSDLSRAGIMGVLLRRLVNRISVSWSIDARR